MFLLILLTISGIDFCDEYKHLPSGIVKARHAQINARPDFVTKMDAHVFIDRAEISPGGDVKAPQIEIYPHKNWKSWNTSRGSSNYNPVWGETYTAVNIQDSFFDELCFNLHSFVVVLETVASRCPVYSSFPIGLNDSAMEFRNITLFPRTNNATLRYGAVAVCTLTECASRIPISSTCSSVLDAPDKACYKVGSNCSLCSSTTCSSCNSRSSCSALSVDCFYILSSCVNITSYCRGTSCSTCNSPESCSALSTDCDYIESSCTNISSYCSGTSCSTCNSPDSCSMLSGDCGYIKSLCTNLTSYCSGTSCSTCNSASSCMALNSDCSYVEFSCVNITSYCRGTSCSTCNSPDSCFTLSSDCSYILSSCINITSYCSGTSCYTCNSPSSCSTLSADCSYILSSCTNVTSYCSGISCSTCNTPDSCTSLDSVCKYDDTVLGSLCFNSSSHCSSSACISCSSKSACDLMDNTCVWDDGSCIEKESNSSLFCSSISCYQCMNSLTCGDAGCFWNSSIDWCSDQSIKSTFQGFWFLVIGVPIIFLVIVVGLIIGWVWCRYRGRGRKRDGYVAGPNNVAQELVNKVAVSRMC